MTGRTALQLAIEEVRSAFEPAADSSLARVLDAAEQAHHTEETYRVILERCAELTRRVTELETQLAQQRG